MNRSTTKVYPPTCAIAEIVKLLRYISTKIPLTAVKRTCLKRR